MKPALSTVCSLSASLDKVIEDYAAGACKTVELWVGMLDQYLERHSADDFRALLNRHNMAAPIASFQGGLLASQGEFRRQHWDGFARRLAQCRELGIETLVLAGDVSGPLEQQDLERVRVSLAQSAEAAAQAGVRLAFEFQGRAEFANNLQTAAALVAEVGNPALGLCLDLFHYYVGPSKTEDFDYLSAENLYHVQLSDLAGTPRELASDGDRILPGDGDFAVGVLIERLQAIGYAGFLSVELMNPLLWRVPPRQFGEIGITALRKLLGQAAMA